MDCSTRGLPVHHQLPEFTQTHVHWVGDAIQTSHPLSSLSPPTFNLSEHQGLFKWVPFTDMLIFCCCFVQLLSPVWHFVTPWTAACHTSLSFTISWSFLKLMSIELVMPSSHLILCHPLLLLLVFPSIRVFSKESALRIKWPHIGASASASVLLMNIQGWFPLGWTGLISQSKGLSRVFSNATVQKHQFFDTKPFLWSHSHIHTWLLKKP